MKSPLQVALSFIEQGADYIHIIDLDGARQGRPSNLDLIIDLYQKTGMRVQMGGGIRTGQQIKKYYVQGSTVPSLAAWQSLKLVS